MRDQQWPPPQWPPQPQQYQPLPPKYPPPSVQPPPKRNRKVGIIIPIIVGAVLLIGALANALFGSATRPVPTDTPAPTSGATMPARTSQQAAGTTPAPLSTASQTRMSFVKACGTSLCLNGQVWHLYGGSTNGATPDANERMDMAVQGHLNTVRLTDWIHENEYDENQWKLVDAMIAAAASRELHILLDLSTYRNFTSQDGTVNKYLVDWKPFLQFVLNRVNTVSGIRYADDPTIAMFALAGEVEPLNTPSNALHITTQQVNDFFARTAAEFKAIDKNHLLEPGGLYQLGWNSGVDYKTIFAIPNIDVCAVHAPAPQPGTGNDAQLTSQYCQRIGKPWIWEEFSQAQGIGDQHRATWFQTVYDSAKQWNSAGTSFWNLGPGTGSGNSDVGPQTPLTWQTVITNAPQQSLVTAVSTQPFASIHPCFCGRTINKGIGGQDPWATRVGQDREARSPGTWLFGKHLGQWSYTLSRQATSSEFQDALLAHSRS